MITSRDKFPSPTAEFNFLTSEESTSYDVFEELKDIFDINKVIAICQTHEDTQTYIRRLRSLSKMLEDSLPDDAAKKYFLYGKFSNRVQNFDSAFHMGDIYGE